MLIFWEIPSGCFRILLLVFRQWIHVPSVYGGFWGALVVNIGSGMCMVGFTGVSAPRAVFLPHDARHRGRY